MSSDSIVSRREDELAIRDLAYRYARIVDRRVYSEIPQVFMPDCELSGVGFAMKGHAELDAGLRKIEMYSATQHCVQNQLTRVEGDRASGEFYCVANHIHVRDGVQYKLDMGIRYEDRYVRTAAGWRIASRALVLIWQQDLPLDLSVAGLAKAAKVARAKGGGSRSGKTREAAGAKSARKATTLRKAKPARRATGRAAASRRKGPKRRG